MSHRPDCRCPASLTHGETDVSDKLEVIRCLKGIGFRPNDIRHGRFAVFSRGTGEFRGAYPEIPGEAGT